MIIKYKLLKGDLHIYFRNRTRQRLFIFKPYIYIIAVLLSVYIPYVIGADPLYSFRFWTEVLLCFIFLLNLVLLLQQRILISIENRVRSKLITTGERIFKYEEDRIINEDEICRCEYPLSHINKVESWKNYFLIGMIYETVILLPKKYIIDKDSFDAMLKRMQEVSPLVRIKYYKK